LPPHQQDLLIPRAFRKEARPAAFTTSERRVLSLLRREEALSRAEIARQLDLSSQAVIKIVDALLSKDLLVAGGKVISGPGQPSIPISLADSGAYTFGISLVDDGFCLVLMNLKGHIFAHDRVHADASDRNALTSSLKAAMSAQITSSGIDSTRLFGIGFAASGFFVGRSGQLNAPRTMEAWALRDLEGELSRDFNLPVWVENDGNAATVGENLYGHGKRYSHFAYIYMDRGLGGGVISGGVPMRGMHGNAGEFTGLLPPHLRPDRPTLPLLLEVLRAHGAPISSLTDLSGAIDLTWPGVEAWLDRTRPAFTQILAAIAAVHDPEAIVLGGNLPPNLMQHMAAQAGFYEVPLRDLERPFPSVVSSDVTADAVALGAAAIPLQMHFF
jgi:predicted NBD/HSP70 family sugar kinase